MENQKKILEALIEKPTIYEIDVIDNSMLPDKLKKRETLTFTVKPPTLEVLAKCALILEDVPEHIKQGKDVKLEEALKYTEIMANLVCIISWGKGNDYPKWYLPFMLKNVTPKEVFMIFQESALKMQTDFFLTSFQIANENPMKMREKKNDSIPTV